MNELTDKKDEYKKYFTKNGRKELKTTFKKAKYWDQQLKELKTNELIMVHGTAFYLLYKSFELLPQWNKKCNCKELESGFTFLDEKEVKDICLKCGGYINTSINYIDIWNQHYSKEKKKQQNQIVKCGRCGSKHTKGITSLKYRYLCNDCCDINGNLLGEK